MNPRSKSTSRRSRPHTSPERILVSVAIRIASASHLGAWFISACISLSVGSSRSFTASICVGCLLSTLPVPAGISLLSLALPSGARTCPTRLMTFVSASFLPSVHGLPVRSSLTHFVRSVSSRECRGCLQDRRGLRLGILGLSSPPGRYSLVCPLVA